LDIEVTVQGRTMPLGEDLSSDDGCTQKGNAGSPTLGPDDRLAVFASSTGTAQGQERIPLPWALVLVTEDGSSETILDGVRDPAGLGWLTSDELVFAGQVGGKMGPWIVGRDGTD
jgi:hypothetical protein